MSFHHNIQIKTLLRGAMGMLSVLLLLVGGAGLHGISSGNDSLKETYSNQLASSIALSDAMLAMTRMRLARKVLPDLQRSMSSAHEALQKFQLGAGKANFDAAQASFASIRTLSIVLVVLGLAVAVLCTVALNRAIVTPVQEALAMFERIARGDLASRITSS